MLEEGNIVADFHVIDVKKTPRFYHSEYMEYKELFPYSAEAWINAFIEEEK